MDENSTLSYLNGKDMPEVPYISIPEMIRQHAQKDSESVAHVYIDGKTFEKEHLTFANLDDTARRFARGLRKLGIVKDDIVILGLYNVPDWMIAMVGIQICGAIPLLFHFDRKDGSDLQNILEKIGDRGKAVIFSAGRDGRNIEIMNNVFNTGKEKGEIIAQSYPNCRWSIMTSDSQHEKHLSMDEICKLGQMEPEITFPWIDPEDTAAIFLTSGSTGSPKLIPHSHFSLMVLGFQSIFAHGTNSKSLFNDRPFGWIEGFPYWEIYTGRPRFLIRNLAVIQSETEYNEILKRVLKDGNFDALIILPDILQQLCQDENETWRFPNVLLGGVPIPRALTKATSSKCDRLIIAYGSSEMALIAFGEIKNEKEYLDYDTGSPVQGVELKVVNSDGDILERGTRGEMYIRTIPRFSGYINNEEKTKAARGAGGWYKSGDSATITPEGHVIVEGRMSDSVIESCEGYLSVAMWEGRLKEHRDIRDAVVASFVDNHSFARVCYAIVLKPGSEMTEADVVSYLLDSDKRSADLWYKILLPKDVVFFDEFPKTYNGKVSRKEVVEICKKTMDERLIRRTETTS